MAAMCKVLLPRDQINRIKYFTARVDARPSDLDKPLRQELYWRALRTIPNLEVILGSFLTHEVKMPLSPIGTGYAKVLKTEEKGSDVNLATHLLIGLWFRSLASLWACSTRRSTSASRFSRMLPSSSIFAHTCWHRASSRPH
jgi:hypothetical protein